MAHGGSAMAHGGARPRSGMSRPAWSVASSQEQLHKMEKTRRRLGMEERCGGALAMVSANSSEAQSWRAVVEMAGGPHLRFVWLREDVDEIHGMLAEL